METKVKSRITAEIKNLVSEKYGKALFTEKLTHVKACARLGIISAYGSEILHGERTRKLPDRVWERVLEWVDSGKKLGEVQYKPLPIEKRKQVRKKKTRPTGILPPPDRYSAGTREKSEPRRLHSLKDLIDQVYDGIMLAMKYDVPKEKWKEFIKEVCFECE